MGRIDKENVKIMEETVHGNEQHGERGFIINEIDGEGHVSKRIEIKWLLIGAGILLLVVAFFLRGNSDETELSNYLGMTQRNLEKRMELKLVETGDGYKFYIAKNSSLGFEITNSDQRVHMVASENEDYKLFGIKLGIGTSDMQHELMQKGYEWLEDEGDYEYWFRRGKITVVFGASNGYVTDFSIADDKSIYLIEKA